MNTYYVYIDDSCYPIVIYADFFIRNKNSGFCNFIKDNGITISFPLDFISDICKVGE